MNLHCKYNVFTTSESIAEKHAVNQNDINLLKNTAKLKECPD